MVGVFFRNGQVGAIGFGECVPQKQNTSALPVPVLWSSEGENWEELSLVCSREQCSSSKLQFLKKMFINSVSVLICFTWLFCPGACLILFKSMDCKKMEMSNCRRVHETPSQ